MRVIALSAIKTFLETPAHADSKAALPSWYMHVLHAAWRSPADVKAQFGTASVLKNSRVVFNIAGNKYRLVTKIKVGRRALPQDSLQRVLERRRSRSAAAAASVDGLTLVAFTDPNDLLSYTLQKEKYERPGVAVHNVLVSNARTWFGAFENPVDAHVRYLDNPDVGRLIACGEPKSPLCR